MVIFFRGGEVLMILLIRQLRHYSSAFFAPLRYDLYGEALVTAQIAEYMQREMSTIAQHEAALFFHRSRRHYLRHATRRSVYMRGAP